MFCVGGKYISINTISISKIAPIMILLRAVFFLRNGIVFPCWLIGLYGIKTGDEHAGRGNDNQWRRNHRQHWWQCSRCAQCIEHVRQEI